MCSAALAFSYILHFLAQTGWFRSETRTVLDQPTLQATFPGACEAAKRVLVGSELKRVERAEGELGWRALAPLVVLAARSTITQ